MRESPRIRRLRSDLKAMEALRAESTILEFEARGNPPAEYLVRFLGKGIARGPDQLRIVIQEVHEVNVRLGASYPRVTPELHWKTPIFHPNVSGSGNVCLGGYGTHWVPSLNLDELCEMLWDMVRYANYDVTSPYNREAADWARRQHQYQLPVDPRPIRDKLAGVQPPAKPGTLRVVAEEVLFLDGEEPVTAELVAPEPPDVLIIE
jgi:ubiquitin-protein ligase